MKADIDIRQDRFVRERLAAENQDTLKSFNGLPPVRVAAGRLTCDGAMKIAAALNSVPILACFKLFLTIRRTVVHIVPNGDYIRCVVTALRSGSSGARPQPGALRDQDRGNRS